MYKYKYLETKSIDRSEGLIKLARETQLLSDRVDTQIRSDSGVTCSPPPLDSVPLVVWV